MATATATAHDVELAAIEAELMRLADLGDGIWDDAEAATRLAFRRYHRASLTGRVEDLGGAAASIDMAIRHLGPSEDLCLLRASVDLKLHQVDAACAHLSMAPALPQRPEGRALLADVDFQCGRYAQARLGYEAALEGDPSCDNIARLANLVATFGDVDSADEMYARAADELTAKEMRSYAWVELQRGGLDLGRGRYAETRDHYDRATAAYSGWWPVEAAIAELTAAEGAQDEALARYAELAARTARPGLTHALGDLLLAAGRSDEARRHHQAALAVYLASAERGEVHYLHHLVDVCAALDDGPASVRWARRDVEVRPGFSTVAALAWALHRAGRSPAAAAVMGAALATGAVDARMFARAATIHRAVGSADLASALAQRAVGLNPRLDDLHVDG